MRVRLPSPFLTDNIDCNINLVCNVFGLEGSNRHRMAQILLELQVNSNAYTDRKYIDMPFIEVSRDAERENFLLIGFSGVINSDQWKNLNAKISMIRGKSEEELNNCLMVILRCETPKEPEESCSCSKGAGAGTVLIALCAQGEMSAELGRELDGSAGLHDLRLSTGFKVERR